MVRKIIITVSIFASILLSGNADALVSTEYTGSCKALAKETGKYPEKKVKGYPSESIYKKMQSVNQLMADGQKSQARTILNDVRSSSKDSFTLSIVHQYLARLAFEGNDFNGAVNHARKVVELNALPVNAILGMKKQVAYAYISKKDYKSAINWLKQYFNQVIKPPVSDYKTLAQLYAQDKQYKNAICPTYIALKKTAKASEKEKLYTNLFGFHYQLKDLNGSAKILSELINFYPNNKKYWEQLFSINYQKGDQAAALAVSELGYRKGLWDKEKEYRNLASLHANFGSPLNAAERLEDGIKKGIISKNEENLKLVARYLYEAKSRKRAIQAYKNVSSYSNSGKYWHKIGNMYFDTEKYKEAISAFEKSVAKVNMKATESGYSYLQMGAAKFYLGQETSAIASLEKAKNYDQTRKGATSWIGFIREKQRIREIMKQDAADLEAEIAAESEVTSN